LLADLKIGIISFLRRVPTWRAALTLKLKAARTGFSKEMIFMANRLFKVMGLAALVVFPAHSQSVSELGRAVAITTLLQFVTEDDVDQRTPGPSEHVGG
jgi:hypothetical protein